ncbi:MAG: BON domain-containing protein [Planctomycetota bacterium]|nr:BON domain-containing protein [Planctomycetota bacterium]
MKESVTSDVVVSQPKSIISRIPAGADQLAGRIKKAVSRATSARIHNLSVKVTGTHVVLDGFCSTFHCYQLAQHAAMRLADDLLVDNHIDVL